MTDHPFEDLLKELEKVSSSEKMKSKKKILKKIESLRKAILSFTKEDFDEILKLVD